MSPWVDLWIILKTFPTVAGLAVEGFGNRLRRGQRRLEALTESQSDGPAQISFVSSSVSRQTRAVGE
jgi:hypothetical protein